MRGENASEDARFPTTHVSAVARVAHADPAVRDRALADILRVYWKPAYKHLRVRWRAPREQAEDLVQGFFEEVVQKQVFASFDPTRARFRTFLRVCLDRHAQDDAKARGREKRGGGALHVPLDFGGAEREIELAGAAIWESPEDCFDREWRRSVIALAIEALRASCKDAGKDVVFTVFERYDLADPASRPTYEQLGRDLGLTSATVTNHLSWARRELRRIVLEMLAEITAGPGELREESTTLLGGGSPT